MEQRALGREGLRVSELGLGCMGMSEFYGPRNDAESIATIHRATDLGMTFIDTADMYGSGHNETLVGRAIHGHRDQVTIATKFGYERDENGALVGINGRPEYVRSACETSLRRLGIETIDLYYQHRVDKGVPIEETVGAMGRLVEEGKVCYLGLSEASPETIQRAHHTHAIAALQTEYSLWSREPERDILPVCRDLGIGFVPYSPLGRGFLTGEIKSFDDLAADDRRRIYPRFQPDNFQKNLDLMEEVRALAEEKDVTPAQLALAWLLAQREDIVPIPGSKRRKYVEENAGAVDVQLSKDDLSRLDAIMPPDAAAGERYPEQLFAFVDR